MTAKGEIHGLMVQFAAAEHILHATRLAWEAGYRQMDAYAPYPVEGLAQQLGQVRSRIPFVVLVAGLVGGGAGFLMQYWTMAVDYPINVGGRPHNSWPAYIPVTFELLILLASLSAFLGMLFLNGLPHPYHPVFSVPGFERASQDRFFLCLEAEDALFDLETTTAFLLSIPAVEEVIVVPLEHPAEQEPEAPAVTPAEREAVRV